jgi:hypothetical protein
VTYRDRHNPAIGFNYTASQVEDTVRWGTFERLDDAGFEAYIAAATDQRTLEAFMWRCLWIAQCTPMWPIFANADDVPPLRVPDLGLTAATTAELLLAANEVPDLSVCSGYRMRAAPCEMCSPGVVTWWVYPDGRAAETNRRPGSERHCACPDCRRAHETITQAISP